MECAAPPVRHILFYDKNKGNFKILFDYNFFLMQGLHCM